MRSLAISWWFKVWGRSNLAEEGIGERDDWMLRQGDRWHGFGNLAPGIHMLDPINVHLTRRDWM